MGLDGVELIMDIEKHFSISIPDREAEKAYTVGKLVDCVAKILNVNKYDFTLRDNTLNKVKSALEALGQDLSGFSLSAKVAAALDAKNTDLILSLEQDLQLKLPGIDRSVHDRKGTIHKTRSWFPVTGKIDFNTLKWKKYIDIILAHNLDKLSVTIRYTSKYEIYIAVMKITVDKIGVDYHEIGLEKSFTDDLGVD
ncbi:MAG: hypothetical protein EOP48_13170 [Sphingobacteriales bacterium]|nr:MAG: hypothetical protein EOP48_13170 [Sphingobacteriales bacterium]